MCICSAHGVTYTNKNVCVEEARFTTKQKIPHPVNISQQGAVLDLVFLENNGQLVLQLDNYNKGIIIYEV